jgi:hypothetical protein
MTTGGKEKPKTLVTLLLLGNFLLLLAILAQLSRDRRASEELSRTMDQALAEQNSAKERDKLKREKEVLLRERLQAKLERDGALDRLASLGRELSASRSDLKGLTEEFERTRTERDLHLETRFALERRIEDALDLLSDLDGLKAGMKELGVARKEIEGLRAENADAARELGRLRRQATVFERLVKALRERQPE